jgi:DNA ligase-1
MRTELPLSGVYFDCLHLDGQDLIDATTEERWAALRDAVPASDLVPQTVTDSVDAAQSFGDASLAAGHEGAMAKTLDSAYEAGRRGAGWLKLKPAHTLDLVVLAVEWGSGRRQGWLSNLHLGARDPETDGFVMLGKTFKGMTDEMLRWQTDKLLSLEIGRDGHVVHVRPELVAEIAFDGLQASPHYPGGMALRFARIKCYRSDKTAAQADTMATVQALFAAQPK